MPKERDNFIIFYTDVIECRLLSAQEIAAYAVCLKLFACNEPFHNLVAQFVLDGGMSLDEAEKTFESMIKKNILHIDYDAEGNRNITLNDNPSSWVAISEEGEEESH